MKMFSKFFIIRKSTLFITVALIAVLGAAIYLISRNWHKPTAEIPVVHVCPVRTDSVEIYGEYVGRVRAQQFVEVHARVEGYLEKMLFEEGTYVEKGQTLFVINRGQYKARVDKARAQLHKDKAMEQQTKRQLDRIRPLYEQNAASRLDLDNAIAAHETAKAAVEMSAADLAQAELELGYTTVQSPLAGQISERHVDIGTLVGPGNKSLLATIVKSDTVLVDFSMTSLDYLKSKERNVALGQNGFNAHVATLCHHNSCRQYGISL